MRSDLSTIQEVKLEPWREKLPWTSFKFWAKRELSNLLLKLRLQRLMTPKSHIDVVTTSSLFGVNDKDESKVTGRHNNTRGGTLYPLEKRIVLYLETLRSIPSVLHHSINLFKSDCKPKQFSTLLYKKRRRDVIYKDFK